MGRHGDPWRNDDHLLTQDPYADLDLLIEPRPRRSLGPILLGVAFVATVTAVIAGVHLLSGGSGGSDGSGGSPGRLGLAPACFSGTGCPSPGAAGRPTATHAVAAGLPPVVQEPTAVPSPHPTATPHATRDGDSDGTTDPPRASNTPASGQARAAEPKPDKQTAHKPTSDGSGSGGTGSGGTGSDRTAKTGLDRAGSDRTGSGTATSARAGTGRPGTSVSPKRAVVKYTVLERRFGQYKAEIAIGNNGDGDLRGLRVQLPISGRVISVSGARAEQRGATLVLVSTELLPSGGGIGVEVVVNGESVAPGDCSLAGGSCDVL